MPCAIRRQRRASSLRGAPYARGRLSFRQLPPLALAVTRKGTYFSCDAHPAQHSADRALTDRAICMPVVALGQLGLGERAVLLEPGQKRRLGSFVVRRRRDGIGLPITADEAINRNGADMELRGHLGAGALSGEKGFDDTQAKIIQVGNRHGSTESSGTCCHLTTVFTTGSIKPIDYRYIL